MDTATVTVPQREPESAAENAPAAQASWKVAIIAKQGRRLAEFACADEASANAMWLHMKRTGIYAPPAHFLVVHDPMRVCRQSFVITAFFHRPQYPRAL